MDSSPRSEAMDESNVEIAIPRAVGTAEAEQQQLLSTTSVGARRDADEANNNERLMQSSGDALPLAGASDGAAVAGISNLLNNNPSESNVSGVVEDNAEERRGAELFDGNGNNNVPAETESSDRKYDLGNTSDKIQSPKKPERTATNSQEFITKGDNLYTEEGKAKTESANVPASDGAERKELQNDGLEADQAEGNTSDSVNECEPSDQSSSVRQHDMKIDNDGTVDCEEIDVDHRMEVVKSLDSEEKENDMKRGKGKHGKSKQVHRPNARNEKRKKKGERKKRKITQLSSQLQDDKGANDAMDSSSEGESDDCSSNHDDNSVGVTEKVPVANVGGNDALSEMLKPVMQQTDSRKPDGNKTDSNKAGGKQQAYVRNVQPLLTETAQNATSTGLSQTISADKLMNQPQGDSKTHQSKTSAAGAGVPTRQSTEELKERNKEMSSRKLAIVFHAALLPEFKHLLEKYDVCITIFKGSKKFNRLTPMTAESELPDVLTFLTARIVCDTNDLYGANVEYKYTFFEKPSRENPQYEVSKLQRNCNNRQLDNWSILAFFKSASSTSGEFVWHQYDGITRLDEGVVQSIKNRFKSLLRFSPAKPLHTYLGHCQLLLQATLPSWEGLCLDSQLATVSVAEDALQTIQHVYFCVRRYFLNESGRNFTDAERKEMVMKYLEKLVEMIQLESVTGEGSNHQSRFGLATFVSIIHITRTCNVVLDEQILRLICRQLLLKPDYSTRTCPDFEELLSVHFRQTSNEIMRSLLDFINKDVSAVSAQWILLLPLVHFLCKASQPFGHLCHIKEGYDDKSQKWWGESEILEAKRKLPLVRNDRLKLHSVIEDYKDELVSLFECDGLLPRTLLALMAKEDVFNFLPLIRFPADASLVNIRYFIKVFCCFDRSYSYHLNLSNLLKAAELITIVAIRMDEDNSNLAEILDSSSVGRHLRSAQELCKISLDLLNSTCSGVCGYDSCYKAIILAMEAVLASVKNFRLVLDVPVVRQHFDQQEAVSVEQNRPEQFLEHGKEMTQNWLHEQFKYNMADDLTSFRFRHNTELLCLCGLVKLADKLWDEDLKKKWMEFFKSHLVSRINTMKTEAIVDLTVKHDFSMYDCSLIDDSFMECTFDRIKKKDGENLNLDSVLKQYENKEQPGKLQEIVSRLLMRDWPADQVDDLEVLKHVLSWPSILQFLKMYDRCSVSDKTTPDTEETSGRLTHWKKLTDGIGILSSTLEKLLSGYILVRDLDILVKFKDQLFKICDSKEGGRFRVVPAIDGTTQSRVVEMVLKWREKERNEYIRQLQCVDFFLSCCKHGNSDDVGRLSAALQCNLNDVLLSNICKPKQLGKAFEYSVALFKPAITAFGLSERVLAILDERKELSKSRLFEQIWNQFIGTLNDDDDNDDDDDDDDDAREGGSGTDEDGENEDDDVQTNEDNVRTTCRELIHRAIKLVWRPSINEWKKLSRDFASGEITVKRMEKIFCSLDNKFNILKTELQLMDGVGTGVINERLEQVKLLSELDTVLRGAEVILEAQEQFKISGDFSDLILVKEMTSKKGVPLRSISRKLLDRVENLKTIDEEQSKCLAAFLENRVLADWLKETVALDELQTFIDIALIVAAGEGAVQLEYVTCLDAVIKGYSPFIYRLSENMSYIAFLDLCSDVWDSLKTAPDLPDKFREAARNLDFLKQIQESHGSVEDCALPVMKSIIQTGTFAVGFHDGKSFTELEDVISARYRREQIGQDAGHVQPLADDVKNVDLKRLSDLHNKLMLIVGRDEKVQREAEMFCEIFDGILRLGKTYIRLCSSGCLLFHHWKVVFFCDPSKKNKVYMSFTGGNLNLKSSDSDVVGQILDVCRFMESCLDDWLTYVEEQREQFYYLNFFTTQQLMILQQGLSKLAGEEFENNSSSDVHDLLSLVKKNCSPYDVYYSFSAAVRQSVGQNAETDSKLETEPDDSSSESSENEDEGRRTFIQIMVDANFSMELASKALESGIDPSSINDGIVWCMENQDVDESVAVHPQEQISVDDEASSQGASTETTSELMWPRLESASLATVTSDHLQEVISRKGTMLDKMNEVWRKFLDQTTESFADCLSLKLVGEILENLAQAGDETVDYVRPMPTYLKTSQPNLIICPKSDILSVVLSIYSFSDGVKLPLPSVDEVLLCNSDTTAEEVELLFRRAAKNREKIYCLVYADLLEYDIARDVEDQLLRFFPTAQAKNLRLVIICCEGRKSILINALDRYRIHAPPSDNSELQRYLKDHFVVKSAGKLGVDAVPASYVDPELCSVRMVRSHRSGVGKTLYVKLLGKSLLQKLNSRRDDVLVTISLHSKIVDHEKVVKDLLCSVDDKDDDDDESFPRIYHINIAPEVQDGVDHLLFSLLVLGCVSNRSGYVWRRREQDLYAIECMPLMMKTSAHIYKGTKFYEKPKQQLIHQIFAFLPWITCWSPQDSLDILNQQYDNVKHRHPDCEIAFGKHDQLVVDKEFLSEELQRPFQYLLQYSSNKSVAKISPITPRGTHGEFIDMLLRHCGVVDPSWAELRNFASFLNVQLKDCENSCFCLPMFADDLPGFLTFVVKFMIRMSKDFATRSLRMSEESPSFAAFGTPALSFDGGRQEVGEGDGGEHLLQGYALKRRWETSHHPYLFFNDDHNSFTFMGFVIDRHTQNLLDPLTKEVIESKILPQNLHHALYRNSVNLQEDFENLPAHEKINKLCSVMGQDFAYNPDESYELTSDNVKKILAIFMRFRCHIPVIIMGETGCGKTRLVRFMCDLWRVPGEESPNMIIMKMHGGTTEKDIVDGLHEAIKIAKKNRKKNRKFGTVLFFDEANTTEAIGLIKEIMCDRTCNGKPLPDTTGLHLIAACNPYRKHSDVMIDRLEQAGLGYRVRADETRDKLGYIPMRQLVYRVQALPQSMLSLVWDFGQLNDEVEELYVRQMVTRHLMKVPELMLIRGLEKAIARVLAKSQAFMRLQENECSFVSLRDVERALTVMMWFYEKGELLFKLMDEAANKTTLEVATLMNSNFEHYKAPQKHTRSLILALGVCYHGCLQNRMEYREYIAEYFEMPCILSDGGKTIMKEIDLCQDVFLDNVDQLGDNIARNKALKENVFMMVVCIELRIPLFLVGKPGSSKSLAKTIVGKTMSGAHSARPLFKAMKLVHMVSFQCSPLSTPEGIIGTFKQCALLQQRKDLDKYVAVVVLDEVGLAEDSPKMPLKTLHPLLEYGCEIDGRVEPYSKVGFIGISNWALDPAKMNRGILVLREVPDEEELLESARGICSREFNSVMNPLVGHLTGAYRELYETMLKRGTEFFGLRDFYSLIKMVDAFYKKSNREPTWNELKHAILRNFDGSTELEVLKIFEEHLSTYAANKQSQPGDPDSSPSGLIKSSLHGIGLDSESRYLLVLTENYVALGLLHQQLEDLKNAVTIFGSSFPKDQEYTQVCRNINRIKTCMENGRTVVLLNLENLYESLYDALNQYYMWFNKQRFVDLGLGTQRVKCKVHADFRLIVVAEKKVVYQKFPIPLINRLEKHILSMKTMLTEVQQNLAKELESWAEDFCNVRSYNQANKSQPKLGDVFIGYHADTAAAVILQLWKQNDSEEISKEIQREILFAAKGVLLQCATPDSLVRLSKSCLAADAEQLRHQYFVEQCHGSLAELIKHEVASSLDANDVSFMQVTTHSLLLSQGDRPELAESLGIPQSNIHIHSLQAFDTEHQFCSLLKEVFRIQTQDNNGVILGSASDSFDMPTDQSHHFFILQCESGDINAELIACARYNIFNEYSQIVEDRAICREKTRIHVVFVVHLPRQLGGCSFASFQGGKWKCFHLDELLPAKEYLPKLSTLMQVRISELLQQKLAPDSRFSQRPDASEMDPERNEFVGNEELENRDVETERVGNRNLQQEIEEDLAKFDVDRLILNCLHRAAAMLKDSEDASTGKTADDSEKDLDSPKRKIRRLNLLLELLEQSAENPGTICLSEVVKQRLGRLLRDKETAHQMPEQAGSWLSDEVSSLEATAKAGTFRRALLQTIESKVTPLLSGIIAYADKDANLDLLDEESPWKRSLWLKMLNEEEMTLFRYRDLNAPDHRAQTGLPEYLVTNTGCDGRFFKCSFPFSWVVKDQIDCMIHQTRQSGKSLNTVIPLLEETELGKILSSSVDVETSPEAFDAYVRDFAHMVYKSSNGCSEAEIKWVIQDLQDVMQDNDLSTRDSENPEEKNLLLQLVDLHLAYEIVRPRLWNFAELLRIWPGSRSIIANKNDILLPLDLKILLLILENLVPPEPKKLVDAACQSEWIKKADSFSPLIQQLIQTIQVKEDHMNQKHCFENCCQMWNRLHAVQLFIKHACQSKLVDRAFFSNRCPTLFALLGNQSDFKQIKTFGALENFLKGCNTQAVKSYIGLGECYHCGKTIQDPVELPCFHVICLACAIGLRHTKVNFCPKVECSQKIPEDFRLEPLKTKSTGVTAHDNCRKCLNSFFMEVVHSLCFLRNTPPTDEVIRKLLEFVTLGAKVTFEEKADLCPVVRSFVLQVLLQSQIDSVRKYLDEYFAKARQTLDSNKEEETAELCVLIVSCIEDYYRSLSSAESTIHDQIRFAFRILRSVQPYQLKIEEAPSVDELESFGKIRFVLNRAATWIHEAEIVANGGLIMKDIWPFLEKLDKFLESVKLKFPRLYLMRLIGNKYGLEILKQLGATPRLHWILLPEARQATEKNKSIPDKFLVYGDNYKSIRAVVSKIAVGQRVNELGDLLDGLQKGDKLCGLKTLLAIYRSITLNYSHSEELKTTEEVKKSLLEYCKSVSMLNEIQKELLLPELIENRLPGSLLLVSPEKTSRQQMLAELITHFYAVICTRNAMKFLSPFASLAFNPAELQNSFFPTMPQVDVEKLRAAVATGDKGNAVLYQCSKGHPYVIGDCGKPGSVRLCPDCGEEIGGLNHQLAPGNVCVNTASDQTLRGYCLGPANLRSENPTAERDMNSANTSLMRLLLHLSMYLGSSSHASEMADLITPKIPANQIEAYIHHHIMTDLAHIRKALGKNEDDVFLLAHLLIAEMTSAKPPKADAKLSVLQTTAQRHEWENIFDRGFIQPVLKKVGIPQFAELQEEIQKDDDIGNSPLFRMLFEADQHLGSGDDGNEKIASHLWRYRTQITLQSLTLQLHNDSLDSQDRDRQHRILKLFLDKQHQLRYLRYLPNVVKLNESMKQHLLKQPNKFAAAAWTLGSREFKESFSGPHLYEEIDALVKDFNVVYRAFQQNLTSFVFAGSLRLSQVQPIDDTTKILAFVPSAHGEGLHSMALVAYLCNIQNQFLEEYSELSRTSLETCVDVGEASPAQIVTFDEQRDVLPLLLANCSYSLKAGEGTTIQYDFAALQRQVEERFIQGRPRLRGYQVDQLATLDDASHAKLFEQLRQRISQEPLPTQLKTELDSMKKNYSMLNDVLTDLETTLGYLAVIGGKPNESVLQFMRKVLKMKPKVKSAKIEAVRLKHFEALWLMVAHMRASCDLQFRRDPFETVDDKYRGKLSDEMKLELENYLETAKDLDVLVLSLFECILFQITTKQRDSESNCDEQLGIILNAYMDKKGSSFEWKIPEDVKVKHCLAAWKHSVLFRPRHAKH